MLISLRQYELGAGREGVACPDCGTRLMDEGNLLYPRAPKQRRFTCPNCGFTKVVKDADWNNAAK